MKACKFRNSTFKYLLSGMGFFLFLINHASAQSSGYYYKYDFQQFLIEKTRDTNSYLEQLYKTMKYPPIARENQIEGTIEILLISDGRDTLEVLIKKQNLKSNLDDFNETYLLDLIFQQTIQKAFEKANQELLKRDKEKYMTELTIKFDLEPFDEQQEPAYPIIITGMKPFIRYKSSH